MSKHAIEEYEVAFYYFNRNGYNQSVHMRVKTN